LKTVVVWALLVAGITLVVAWIGVAEPGTTAPPAAASAFNFEEASRNVPKPRELYPLVKQDMVPMDLKILSDEIVASDTDPSKKLRKITGRFHSIELENNRWIHPFVLLTPADNSINQTPQRKGKVVVITSPGWVSYPGHVEMYGEPIAARTGYPTMILLSPGVYADGRDIEADIAVLDRMRQKTGKNYYNMNCQLALVYIQAMNVLETTLKLDTVKAVVGGHSKRGRSATVAAAMDPRVAGVVIMGNEGVYRTDQIQWHLSFHHAFFQEQVNVPVLYIGASNEGGYKMFNVNLLQERLRRPMTIELIPNYHHYNFDEKQFIDFMMWVSHVFDDRPITHITELKHERRAGVNVYRAKIKSDAKIRLVRVWYVYATNTTWSDLMWYDWLMENRGDYYEARVPGAMPDAFMIEVADTAQGIPGYVTSLPQKLTDAPVVERDPSQARWMGPPERQEGKEK
jgi:dienelactone hydrolase